MVRGWLPKKGRWYGNGWKSICPSPERDKYPILMVLFIRIAGMDPGLI